MQRQILFFQKGKYFNPVCETVDSYGFIANSNRYSKQMNLISCNNKEMLLFLTSSIYNEFKVMA
jgi:hypothetical protein